MNEKGQVLIIGLIFMLVILTGAVSIISWGASANNFSFYINRKSIARELAKAGLQKAIFCLNGDETAEYICGGVYGENYDGETNTEFGKGIFTVAIDDIDSRAKQITSTGYYPSAVFIKAKTIIKSQIEINTDEARFNFGVQVGDGGLIMKNNTLVTGNVFSNGNITGTSAFKCSITGDASSAGTSTISKIKVFDNMRANTISSSVVMDDAYYNNISGSMVFGHSYHPYPNPEPEEFPITDEQITGWKNDAADGGTHNGDLTLDNGGTTELGPQKIVGNLTLDNNSTLMLTGVIYVTGNITLDNGSAIHLDPAYGERSGVIVADGTIIMGNATIDGASHDSTVMLLTTATGGGANNSAIEIKNNAIGAVFFAPNGLIWVNNRVWVTELVGKSIDLEENAILWYDYGLRDAEFSSGPGGGWAILEGAWQEL